MSSATGNCLQEKNNRKFSVSLQRKTIIVCLYSLYYPILKEFVLKNFISSFVVLFILFAGPGCLKKTTTDCTPKTTASEAGQIQAYAAANSISATAHSSGLYYQVINPGSGPTASATSTIYITYLGKLLDGTVFDQQSNSAATGWALNQLIEGWRVGIPLIQKGGEIKLIVPSSMAYGCGPYGSIPGNSILYFDITLVNIQ